MNVEVWIPGATVDLDALKREYDTIIFTRAAIRAIEGSLCQVVDALETTIARNDIDSAPAELAIDEARSVIARLRDVL